MWRGGMKKLFTLTLVLLLLSGIVGCSKKDEPFVPPASSVMSEDEACALVYSYLETRAKAAIGGVGPLVAPPVQASIWRRQFLDTLVEQRQKFSASYQGNGKWLVYDDEHKDYYYYSGGLWNLYEASRIVEPANDQARELLSEIRSYGG
jgi:predicted small lipoprotein YifL